MKALNKLKKIDIKNNSSCTYEFNEGLDISVFKNGLLIESTDYHAFPCFINQEQLKLLCLNLDMRKTEKMEKYKKNNSNNS